MKMVFRCAVFAGIAAVVLLGGLRADAQGGHSTFCVDRPTSFDPLFNPSGCFTYKPIDGGVIVVGRALLGSQFLALGRPIEARVNGNTCGSTAVPGADGVFVLPIAGADSQAGCATGGDRVDFYMDGVPADQSLVWPSSPGPDPRFLSLSSVTGVSWYWFERASMSAPRVGTMVQALTNGTVCGETTIGGQDQALGPQNRPKLHGFLRLVVAATNMGCGQAGTLVEFRVNGLRAETALLYRPGVQRLDLLVQGDANCDFLVDPRDATLVLQYVAGLITSVPCHGDADRTGVINVFDAQDILQLAAGLINALPL